MAARGMMFYDGKFRTPQDVAIRERDKQAGTVEVDWFGKIRLWRGWLDKRARPAGGRRRHDRGDQRPRGGARAGETARRRGDECVFELLLAVLGRLDHPAAMQTLVAYSLDDDEPEIRQQVPRLPDQRARGR